MAPGMLLLLRLTCLWHWANIWTQICVPTCVCSMNIVHLRVYLQCAMYMVLNMVQGEPRTPLLCFHVFECKLICVSKPSKPLAVCLTVATYILCCVYVCAIVHVFLHIYILMCACVRVCVFGGPPFGPQHSSIESEYFVRGGQYWEVNPISLNHEELKMLGWRRWPCWGWSLWLAQLGRVIRISAGCNASDTYTDTWQKSPACTEHICFDFFPFFFTPFISA